MSSAGTPQSGQEESADGLPTTAEMMAQLDQVSETIPKLLENLSSAMGVLSQGQEEGQEDKWEEHLRGYGAQYLGRLNLVQGILRSVVHTMRSLERSPYALQPPHPNALPASFSTAQIPTSTQPESDDDDYDLFSDPEEKVAKAKKVMDDAEKEARELSLYACRLERKALKELAESLRAMKREKEKKAASGGPSNADTQEAKDSEDKISRSEPEDRTSSAGEDVEMDH